MRGRGRANGAEGRLDWHGIDWRRAEKTVRNLRRRIFRASREGDRRKVRALQRLMLRSHANRALAVRRVTQTNAGRHTPGVDGLVVQTPAARARLVAHLARHQPWRASPVRRVCIPKADGRRRPLGIPTIADRAMQAVVKNALEPEWEARFEPCSFGFRPGRGCHDAIERIFTLVRPRARRRWVVDADIKGAFDHLNHETILGAIAGFPARELVKQWLKAGVMEDGAVAGVETGAPQGGVISPLLANIALHGMEAAVGVAYRRGAIRGGRALVRYADDFVIITESREDAEAARAAVAAWLAGRGLELAAAKTRIVDVRDGFDFLGFTIRQYPARASRNGWKLLIKPSRAAVGAFRRDLKARWRALKGRNAAAVVHVLNPLLKGWANYHRAQVAKETFRGLDHWMFGRAVRWARSTHPKKPWRWLARRYFGRFRPGSRDRWVFGVSGERYLYKLAWTPIRRHVLVPGSASPDDPSLRAYWDRRRLRGTGRSRPSRPGSRPDRGASAPSAAPTCSTARRCTCTTSSPAPAAGVTSPRTCASCTCSVTSTSTTGAGAVRRGLPEPCAGKLARTVLRGRDGGNAVPLPDQKVGARKQPHLIRLRAGAPMAFAGLWERWTAQDGQDAIESFAIIVTEANARLRPIHDRMPVILAPEDFERWLDPEAADGRELLQPCPPEWLEAYAVGTSVNRPQNNDPDLLQPVP